jgi:hypothetical protein
MKRKTPPVGSGGVTSIWKCARLGFLHFVARLHLACIEEVFRLQRILVDAVDGIGRGQALALRLAGCFVGRTSDVEFDFDRDFRMKVQRDLVLKPSASSASTISRAATEP